MQNMRVAAIAIDRFPPEVAKSSGRFRAHSYRHSM